jgi:cytochrome c5
MRVRSILAAAGVACATAAAAATYAAAQEPPPAPAPQQATPSPAPAQAPDPKAILESACTTCHGLDFITDKRKDPAAWEFTVNQMISRGADLNPDEAKLVIDYLAKTYPADAPPATAPAPDAPKPGAAS